MGWVTIAVAVSGMIFTVAWYLVQRRVSRIDLLEQAVFGETGVRERMAKFITRQDFESRVGELTLQLRGVSEEGQKREDRILSAIQNQTAVLRSEIRDQATRIDAIFHPAPNAR